MTLNVVHKPGYRFDILGYKLTTTVLPDVIEEWLKNRWYFPQHTVPNISKEIQIIYTECCPDFPQSTDIEVLNLQEMQLECRQEKNHYYLGNVKEGSSLNPETYVINVWGKSRISLMSLQVCLAEILRLSGYVPLHASVIAKNGKATAFSAPSGTGKTTTLLSAFKAGFDVIAEDFIWIKPDSLQVFAWDKGVRLLSDTYERFKHLLPEDFKAKKDIKGKVFVPYSVLGIKPRSNIFLESLVCLNRDPGRATVWGTVSKREATMKLWEGAGIPFTKQASEQLPEYLPRIIKSINLKSLQIGNTAIF